jgi:hypothetical protein
MWTRSILLIPLILSGCAEWDAFVQGPGAVPVTGETAATLPAAVIAPLPPVEARTVEEFDTTTADERAAAVAVPAAVAEVEIGTTIASLGSPTVPGIWMETPLVSEVVMGRVSYPLLGTSVALELRPSNGAAGSGSQISLAAMRLLGVPLTELPELVVFR